MSDERLIDAQHVRFPEFFAVGVFSIGLLCSGAETRTALPSKRSKMARNGGSIKDLLFLGTSAGVPTRNRNVSATALIESSGRGWYLVDCLR
jgi:hypothetical protein